MSRNVESYLQNVTINDDGPDECVLCEQPLPGDDLALLDHFKRLHPEQFGGWDQ